MDLHLGTSGASFINQAQAYDNHVINCPLKCSQGDGVALFSFTQPPLTRNRLL